LCEKAALAAGMGCSVAVLRARIVHFCAGLSGRFAGRRGTLTIQYVARRWKGAGSSMG
jgi:hypothetical protein